MAEQKSDFSLGSISGNILRLAVPMTFAQLINVLYNIVDRIYLGHLPGGAATALTGVGLTFPILSVIVAFANLFGMGGAPLFSIARGRGDTKHAAHIMGVTFTLLLSAGAALTALALCFKRPLLYLFGASDATFPYADGYLTIYLLGSVFVMMSLGLNGFINAQGFGRKGMMTVLLGAGANLVLDPIFIFVLNMGVQGAAIATVISQALSAAWAVSFLAGPKALVRLDKSEMRFSAPLTREIVALGLSTFIMSITNSAVQIACNATLQSFGGDLYVGVMTIINSIREIVMVPMTGLTGAAQPVLGYNYGAQCYRRVKKGIFFTSAGAFAYAVAIWLALLAAPRFFAGLFTEDAALLAAAVPSMHIYFFGIFMMALQNSAQSATVALGRSRQAIFFSLLRKVFIVVPLTLWLPHVAGLGVNGVFMAEPISNFVGGGACYITMLLTIGREMTRRGAQEPGRT